MFDDDYDYDHTSVVDSPLSNMDSLFLPPGHDPFVRIGFDGKRHWQLHWVFARSTPDRTLRPRCSSWSSFLCG